MSTRPEQPEPFLRGCVFPAVTDAPYPRADPAGAEYLPADVWDAAQLPVGVRLELAGNARTIRVWYKTTRASLGYRGESAGCSFVAYRAGQKVATVEAVMGEGMAELVLAGRTDLPVTVYLPEGMQPLVTGVAGVEETMIPAPPQPRWLAYGDAVTQGWLASAPAMAWPAVAGRKLGLDVCNLGYAGTARGESTSAVLLAETPAEVISIAFGLNNWSRVPHTAGLMAEEVRCFLAIVRKGHPDAPIVVVSPTARPDAEDSPNRVGATLAELRLAMEEAVLDWIGEGDKKVFLVEGLGVVGPEDLEDGIYPGDEGHRRLAAAVAKVLVPHLSELQEAARLRWTNERLPALAAVSSTALESRVPETPFVDLVVEEPDPAGPVDEESVAGQPVAEQPVAEESVEAETFDDASDSSNWWADEPETPSGDVFDPTPPAGISFELDPLEDEPQCFVPRNLDLPDVGSLGRESLNDALMDALSSNGPIATGSAVDGAPVDDRPADNSVVDDSLVGETYAGESYAGESYAGESYAGESYAGESYAGESYAGESYAAESYAGETYTDETYSNEILSDDSPVDDSPVDDSPVDDGRPVEAEYAEYAEYAAADQYPLSVEEYSYVDEGPATEDAAAVFSAPPAYEDLPVQPVVVPTLEDTLAQAAAPAPAGTDQTADLSPVPVPPVPPPEFDDFTLDPPEAWPETASVETAPVARGPVEPDTVETTPAPVPSPTAALNGEAPVSPPAPTTRAPAPTVRRETGHVDIAVADMVVAALTLATNGADDVIYGLGPASSDGLQWAEASDPGSF